MSMQEIAQMKDDYKYGFHVPEDYVFKSKKGLSEEIVREISAIKKEPKWMLDFRLKSLEIFWKKQMPKWGADLGTIDFQDIYYYLKPTEGQVKDWTQLPEGIKSTFDRLGIPEAERNFLAGAGAQFDCLTSDTKIPTNPNGLKSISELKEGDYIFALNEKTKRIEKKRILAVINKGIRPVFEIRIAGRVLKATFNHPFLSLINHKKSGNRRGRYKTEWKYLNELKSGDLVAIAKKLPIEGKSHKLAKPKIESKVNIVNQFGVGHEHDLHYLYKKVKLPDHTSEDLMWLFGLFIGDGWLDKNGKRISFAIPESEGKLREELISTIKKLFDVDAIAENKYKISIGSKIIYQFFLINGFSGYAKTKCIPEYVYSLPEEELLAFLGGYLDSDGNVRQSKECHDAILTSINKSLLENFRAIAFYVGLQCSIVTTFKQKDPFDKKTERIAHRLHISGNLKSIKSRNPDCYTRFGKTKYTHNFSSSENSTFRQHVTEDMGFARIESIKFLGEENVFDITVEDHHNFVAEGIIVHNSETVYHKIREDLEAVGVIFTDMDTALREHSSIVKKYFGTVIPYNDNKFAALNSAVWSGGCLTADTQIFTANPGVKPIIDVQEDDMVYALNNNGEIEPSRVIAKVYSGKKDVYEVFAGGRRIEATSNHMFLCAVKSEKRLNNKGKKWHLMWKPLERLKKGDIIVIAKKIPDNGLSKRLPELKKYVKNKQHETLKIPNKTNEDLMWFLGLWLGDGCTYSSNPHVCQINIALPESDSARREAIRIVKKLFGYEVTTKNKASFTIYSKALGEWLKDIEFIGKAKTKRIPRWVFGLPLSERLALLGGLLDTDGWTENSGKIIRFELANQGLVEDIKLLANSCGLFSDGKILKRNRTAAFFKREQRKIYSSTTYSCRITGNLKRIAVRNPEKKKEIINSQKGTFDKYTTVTGENLSSMSNEWIGFAPIREKNHMGVKDVYDIQVENHANFIANGIVVHNSFVYVPAGVKVDMPLQAYFRINAQNMGQFERTLIIVEPGSFVSYLEGCTAPVYASDSLHAAVVEVIAMENARVRYTTIQNWSNNVYNLVTKRAFAHKNATVEWIDGNLGSKITMKYPSVYLLGEGAKADILSIAFAGKGQHQDAGAKAVHMAPNTTSTVISKSISTGGGRTTYRGLLRVDEGCHNSKSHVKCDALILDDKSASDTVPYMEINEKNVNIGHEATTGKISEDQVFYLMSRGLSEQQAMSMIVSGFIEPFIKELPLEYAIELNRLIQMEMEGSVG